MYAQLGDIIFDALIGPESYDDNQETDYALIPLINRKPKLQRTGEKLQEINLTISFRDQFCIPEEQTKILQDKRINGEVMTLTWGSGDIEGDFVIKSIKKVINALSPFGQMRDITLTVALIEYYNPDKIGAIKKLAKRNAFATSLTAPTPENLTVTEPSPATSVMKDITGADLNNAQTAGKLEDAADKFKNNDAIIDAAQVYVNKVKADLYQVKRLIKNTQALLTNVGVKLAQYPVLNTIANTLASEITATNTAVTQANTLVDTFQSLPDPVTTLVEANQVLTTSDSGVTAAKNLRTCNDNVRKAAQPLAVAIAKKQEIET
jgi:phage protein U